MNIQDLEKERISVLLFATLGGVDFYFFGGWRPVFYLRFFWTGIAFHPLFALWSPDFSHRSHCGSVPLAKHHCQQISSTQIEGESLFNDGIGVIVFTSILLVANMGEMVNPEEPLYLEILKLFGEELSWVWTWSGLGLPGILADEVVSGRNPPFYHP